VIKVLHITPHLGGGVGKALSGLITQSMLSNSEVHHVVACLEAPEKYQFVDRIQASGSEVLIAPNQLVLEKLISTVDIVQLEWWNHPATIECLCRLALQPIRLLVWCHVSGIHNPIIPQKLIEVSHRFLFTSPCSFEAQNVIGLAESDQAKLAVVSSGGGFEELPEIPIDKHLSFSVGYFGSLNFAKLHPDYVKFLSAVNLPDFQVRLIGDLLNREILEGQCSEAGRVGMLDFRGYTTEVVGELSKINVLAYILNPRHYGTAENALLEAMAMGIVPVVLDNLAERNIVEHLNTGLIVKSPAEFAEAIEWLEHNPLECSAIGNRAARAVRDRFSLDKMNASFCSHYYEVMHKTKRIIQFSNIFGTTPVDWFVACQGEPEIFKVDGTIELSNDRQAYFDLYEKTKGSVFHFQQYFPNSTLLNMWSKHLERLQ
jgi:glycosyltransferase involved in cell wall biosynthesis